jgi:hypothetical protein
VRAPLNTRERDDLKEISTSSCALHEREAHRAWKRWLCKLCVQPPD